MGTYGREHGQLTRGLRATVAFAVVAIALFMQVEAAFADQATEDAHLAEIRAMLATATDSTVWNSVERKALLSAKGRADRYGDTLTLHLANGGQRTFQNHEKECRTGSDVQQCRIFWLEAHLPTRHFFIVRVGFYEGEQYLLTDDRTGTQTSVSAEPRFGPDPGLVLVIDDDEAYGSGRELQVWRRKGDRAVLEWDWTPQDEALHIDLLRWSHASEILLEMHSPEFLDHPARRWPATLHRDREGWHLEMESGYR